jgi:hypothetical protein
VKGPAVVAPYECEFHSPVFYGELEAILWERPAEFRAVGAIDLQRCVFTDCTFENIGLTGNPEFIASVRESAVVRKPRVQ